MVLALVLNPDVQRRAQSEIDSVTNRTRLPSFQDLPSLPYIDAIVCETLRWNLILPLGSFRKAVNDDIYGSKVIPAGKLGDFHGSLPP